MPQEKCLSHDLRAAILQAVMDAEFFQRQQVKLFEREGVGQSILGKEEAKGTLAIARGHQAVVDQYNKLLK